MENPLLTSNHKLLVRRLRMNKNNIKAKLFPKTINIRLNDNVDKSFNYKNDKKNTNIFPSLSKTPVKYYTKSNSRASSAKEEIISEKNNKSFIKKKNVYNHRKISLKLPDKFDNLKKMRNRMIKRESNYFRTENNQKIIFNNIGINYHKNRSSIINNNMKSFDKKDTNSVKHYEKWNDKEKILLMKNNKLENEKAQKDNKIGILEQKIDKLIKFIKDNETSNLKNKISELENEIKLLKKENEKLQNELEIKNKIISSSIKDNNLINKNKEDGKYDENKSSIKIEIIGIDYEKLKNITIDPDDI